MSNFKFSEQFQFLITIGTNMNEWSTVTIFLEYEAYKLVISAKIWQYASVQITDESQDG